MSKVIEQERARARFRLGQSDFRITHVVPKLHGLSKTIQEKDLETILVELKVLRLGEWERRRVAVLGGKKECSSLGHM